MSTALTCLDLGAVLPRAAAWTAAPIAQAQGALFDVERQAITRAALTRRLEFTAGRTLARELLARFGAPGPIPVATDGSPAWPEGWCGSLTHAAHMCAATVIRRAHVAGIGIDIEPTGAVEPELWPAFADARELEMIARSFRSASDAGTAAWCAKESAYKALRSAGVDCTLEKLRLQRAGDELHVRVASTGPLPSARVRLGTESEFVVAGAVVELQQ